MTPPWFHIVLVEPEIPNNTGNIGRTAIAAHAALHLVHPLGFQTDDKHLKRAGMDYWPRVDVSHHDSWRDYEADHMQPADAPRHFFCTTKASRHLWETEFRPGDRFVFGKESVGLDPAILEAHPDQLLTVPMAPAERSINLASCVAIVLYEALRQLHANHHLMLEADARLVSAHAQQAKG